MPRRANRRPTQPQRAPASQPVPQPAPAAPIPTAAGSGTPTDKATLEARITALEAARNSRVIVYWLSDLAKMAEAAVLPLYDHLAAIGKQPRIDLLLQTRGGDSEVPWRMVSLIREFTDHFGVLVPHRAASAGTVLTMGADEIVMTPLGVLGPIDPARTHPLLPRREGATEAEPISVQDMRHAMEFIRGAAGPDKEMPYTPEAMAQIFTALFDKVHPLAIGAIEQSYALAKLIGKKCLATHMDPTTDKAKIDAIVDTLCDEFKSHQYPISRVEAREIGLNAVNADSAAEAAMFDVYKFYTALPVTPAGPPPTNQGAQFTMHIAWMDSAHLHFRVEQELRVGQKGQVESLGDQWLPY